MWIKGPIALPYPFPVDQSMLYYGNYMELYEIHSNPTEQEEDHIVLKYEICSHPIAIDNSVKERDIYGFDM